MSMCIYRDIGHRGSRWHQRTWRRRVYTHGTHTVGVRAAMFVGSLSDTVGLRFGASVEEATHAWASERDWRCVESGCRVRPRARRRGIVGDAARLVVVVLSHASFASV